MLQPGGGKETRGTRPVTPDPVVAQGREDALQHPGSLQDSSKKCGGRETAPLNDIPERELGAWARLRNDSEEATSRPGHKAIHDCSADGVDLESNCHLVASVW
jgi:hypothetical protein